MKILLKILIAPFALALSLLAALLVFLFDICAVLLTIASVILAVLGVALFFTPTPIGGIVFLFLEMSRNVQSGNTQNLKSSAAPVRLPAAPASTPGTSQAVAQAGCVYRP
mgnify:CR=1 FL=1